ncbi:MAG: aminotransferase class V-fold PLP-dependent enzyme, partial [Clostridia bacterium]|nr:aminotransferase class V-fold PLP-dependent enzyme [Clostridia bacterium]
MEHYLDNSSTTKPSRTATEALERALSVWGNPSSVHGLGQRAASLLRDSRKAVAKSLGMPAVGGDRLIFTSSGTEANNIALIGSFRAKKRDRQNPGTIIISDGEHPSIDMPA